MEGADSTVVLYEADAIGKQTQGDNNRFRIQVNASPLVAFDTNQTKLMAHLMAERLSPDGVVESWMLAGHDGDYEATLAAFHEVFPYIAVFRSRRYFAYHVLGSRVPLRFSEARLRKLLTDPRLREDLGETDLSYFAPDLFQQIYVTDQEGVKAMIAGREPLTDDRPILEYRTLRGLEEKLFVFPSSVMKPLVLAP